MLPELFHYSRKPVTKIRPVDTRIAGACYKPAGFWVSVDAPDSDGESWGWRDWCLEENWGASSLAHRHRVMLNDAARVLHIMNLEELYAFDARYCKAKDESDRLHWGTDGIAWNRVILDYTGLIIAPYQHAARFEFMWYYGWDCASGVIWDTSIITGIELCE